MNLKNLITIIFGLALTTPATAHEFWIEPVEFQVEKDTPIIADLRNGELFKGSQQSYFPARNTRLDVAVGDDMREIEGRMGDRPAIQLPAAGDDGLVILLHEAAPSNLTYREWAKFLKFVAHKDFTDAVAMHEANSWPKENFKETYTRHSKALIAVGDGTGMDRAFGMATEFVALENPYDPDFDGALNVALFYQGAPRADAQIEVFEKSPEGDVEVTLHRTDEQGRASIPTRPGMAYLFDAVVLRPAKGDPDTEDAPLWETLWAALTFAVPARQ